MENSSSWVRFPLELEDSFFFLRIYKDCIVKFLNWKRGKKFSNQGLNSSEAEVLKGSHRSVFEISKVV